MMMVASVIVLLSMGVSEAFLKLREHPVVRFHKSSCNIAISPRTVEDSVDIEKLVGGMKYRLLPHSDLKISEIGLGTMTFGAQVRKTVAFSMMDKATKEFAINLLDTSEGFPQPLQQSTYGATETIIGEWLKQNPKSFRDKVVLSTKVVGSCPEIDWMRKDSAVGTRVTEKQVEEAVDNSLRRLKTDHIDILSFQWPDRYVVYNGGDEYFEEFEVPDATPIRDQLEFVAKLIKKGKIRYFALSNETPYGIGAFTATADEANLPRPILATNHYSLLDRYDLETGMKEALKNANLPFVAYSPMAGGALSGKYSDDFREVDAEARMRKYPGFYARFVTDECRAAIKKYVNLAKDNSVPLAPLALAWVYQQPFVTSTLVGATSVEQLEMNILSKNFSPLNKELNENIDRIYRAHLLAGRGPAQVYNPFVEVYDPRQQAWGLREEDLDPEYEQMMSEFVQT
jgi:aryl-alcohol dehydrogenase-like predicted oxidoreductase